MKVKDLNLFRMRMFEELSKIEEIKEALKNSDRVYLYDLQEKQSHDIIILTNMNQMNMQFLLENGYSTNASVDLVYIIDKKLRQVF